MIEDPNLTRQILEYFAQDDVKFPANKSVKDDLTREFPDHELSHLEYHVMCAKKNGFLIVDIREVQIRDGTEFVFGSISGLTAKGGEYVRGSRSKYWDEAKEKVFSKGLDLTTGNVFQAMSNLISAALAQ